MSYRIMATIRRGMTDATAVCVFPWELALMEEVHTGANASEVSIEEMSSLKGSVSVKPVKLKTERQQVADKALSLEEQLRAMCRVDAEDDPKLDLDTEYHRLAEKYGMHPEVNQPVVKVVYGTPAQFRLAVKPFLGSKPPKGDIEETRAAREEQPAPEDEEKPIAEMTKAELQARLKKEKVDYPKGASLETLRDLLETATA